MKLVIAEKPSVAQSIARVIGAAGRKDGYLEGNGYLVSWCVGHLVELSAPETYDERYSKWHLEDLPILPDSRLYHVSPGTKKQFGILKELMKRPDVESLVCATDAGFRYEILTKDFLSRTQGQLDRPEWTMNQAREYVLDLAGLDHRSRFAVSYDMVKQKSRDVLKSSDVRNIEWVDSKYYPGMRTAEHTLTCEIRGEPFRLTYEVSKHDDGEGFVIHSDGKDIWDLMPEPELEKLEFTLSRAVTFGHWKKDIDQAETVVAVRDVRYGICETENLNLTREQIQELHEMIDRKEETLTAAMKKDSVLKQLGETKPENGEKKAPKRQKKQKEGERT